VIIWVLFFAGVATAQDRARMTSSMSDKQVVVRKTTDPTYIPAGSKVYVANIDGLPGFENNLVAAFQKKRVDLFVVADRSQADFEVNGFARSKDAGWAKIIFGSGLPESEASIQLVNLKNGVVAYAVASYKVNSVNGNKSTAEHLAKNLRQKMERDDRRIR
jgi:3D (Asp-Asp-Asp) domain-containing protein